MADPIPSAWLPAVRMDRLVLHWSGGPHKATSLDRKHYHFIFEDDGKVVRGNRSIADNVPPLKTYAAHTKNCNSYSIGLSVASMLDAVERPLSYGKAPMTRAQFDAMCMAAAQLCKRYGIPISPKTVLWHAEVQGTLGIKQDGKWDATVLPFMPSLRGAKAVGDYTRETIAAFASGKRPVAPTPTVSTLPPFPTMPIPSPQPGAGGAAGFPESETAGDPEKGSGGRVGLWLGILAAIGVTGAAGYFGGQAMGWW